MLIGAMTLAESTELLSRLTYKPGWHFALRPAATGHVELEIQAPVVNSWPPHTSTNIAMSFYFHLLEWEQPNRFYAFVRASVERVEQHEAREWFRVDGESWPTTDHSTF